jgi:HK97 gp10 family phage protein
MSNIKVTIQGLDGFIEGLNKFPEFTVNELNKAVTRSVGLLQNTAIKEAPVNKQASGGNLRQMIHSRMNTKLSGEVSADASYSIFVEEGTRPHEIRPVAKKGLANVRQGQFFGKLVRHPGTKPNPFMQRAVDKITPRANQLFLDGLNNVLNKIASLAR